MPTYDYHCEACGQTFEASQRMSDPPLDTCQNDGCGEKGKVRRLMGTGAGLIFKGSGFYITDYKDAGKAKPAAATATGEKSDSAKSDSAAASTSESKAEAKSDSAAAPSAPSPSSESKSSTTPPSTPKP